MADGAAQTDDDSATRAERLLASIDGVVWEADPRTANFTYVSPQAESLLGYPSAQWLEPGFWAAHIHPDEREATVDYCELATRNLQNHYLEYRMLAHDGRSVWIGDSVNVVERDGQPERLCGVMLRLPDRRDSTPNPNPNAPAAGAALVSHGRPVGPAASAADIARQERLYFLECVERLKGVVRQDDDDIPSIMGHMLDVLIDIFDCDRARLVTRRKAGPARWIQQYVRSRGDVPAPGLLMAKDDDVDSMLETVMAAPGAVRFDPESAHPLSAELREAVNVQSILAMRIDSRIEDPYVLALHQSRFPRVWTASECRLYEQLARRIGELMSGVLARHALQLSESRLADAQRLARIGYWERDLDAGLITLSEETCHILGVPPFDGPQDLDECNARWLSHVHADDRERVAQTMDHTIRLGAPYDVEYRLINLEGETLHLRSIGRDIPRGPGVARRWFGTLQDNTPLRRMEQELRHSEARFQAYLDHTTDAITVHDTIGRIIEVNRQLCTSLGYTREELCGQFPTFYDPDITVMRLLEIGRHLDKGEVVSFRSRHRRKDGTAFPTEVRIRRFTSEGRPLSVGVARDISEQVKAEQALQESHAMMRAIVEGSADAIHVKDSAGRYLLINAAGAWRLGHPVDDIIGRTDAELAQDRQATVIARRELNSPQLVDGEMFEESVSLAGATRHYLTTRHRYRDAAQNDVGVVGISRDITELRRLEEQLRHAQKMDAIGRLAGGVAHDFNNLLTVILGYGSVMRGRLARDDINLRPLDEILKCGERAANLIRQLLAFSRKQTLHPARVHLKSLLLEWRDLIRPLLSEDIDLKFDIDDEVGPVQVDPVHLEQALTNLAINARDAMPDGGRLQIALHAVDLSAELTARHGLSVAGPYAQLRISDTGVGMDAATLSQIFEPFFTTKSVDKGTGLGLAMVYGFVTQSAGHIEVHSAPGDGTQFSLLLPCVALGDEAAAHTAAPPSAPTLHGHETVLLVEDEPAVRKLTRELLEQEGYRVIEARDGVDALQVVSDHADRIDLLLTDVVMPRMKGPELADKLLLRLPDLRVLFMSGHSDRSGGALPDVMVKPFRPETLAKRVRDTLDAQAAPRPRKD